MWNSAKYTETHAWNKKKKKIIEIRDIICACIEYGYGATDERRCDEKKKW